METSEFGLPFLATFIYKEDQQLKTRVYHKPTDNKQYLLYTSCHPKQHKDAIPYGLLVRTKRICTKNEDFISVARSIIRTLRTRKYPESTLISAVNRILSVSTDILLNRDNLILFEYLSFVETPPPMGWCMGNWVDGWFSGSMGGIRSYYQILNKS